MKTAYVKLSCLEALTATVGALCQLFPAKAIQNETQHLARWSDEDWQLLGKAVNETKICANKIGKKYAAMRTAKRPARKARP